MEKDNSYMDSWLHNIFYSGKKKNSCSYIWKKMQGFSKIIRSNLEKTDSAGEIFQSLVSAIWVLREMSIFLILA